MSIAAILVISDHYVQDIDDLQNFACKHKVDFVAASFVQSKDDVLFIRKTLDKAGGHDVKIISKIENMAGLENFDGRHPIACISVLVLCPIVSGSARSRSTFGCHSSSFERSQTSLQLTHLNIYVQPGNNYLTSCRDTRGD